MKKNKKQVNTTMPHTLELRGNCKDCRFYKEEKCQIKQTLEKAEEIERTCYYFIRRK